MTGICGYVRLDSAHAVAPHYQQWHQETHNLQHCLPAQEDPWNSISAGALTGGFLQLRTGARSAAKSAAFGGVLLVRAPGLECAVGARGGCGLATANRATLVQSLATGPVKLVTWFSEVLGLCHGVCRP